MALKEIVLAQPAIAISLEPNLLSQLIEEIRLVTQFGHGLDAAISEWLKALTAEIGWALNWKIKSSTWWNSRR